MPLKRLCNFLLLLPLFTACSSQSSASELTKELQTVTSWAATAQMVGDAWTRGVEGIDGAILFETAKPNAETAIAA